MSLRFLFPFSHPNMAGRVEWLLCFIFPQKNSKIRVYENCLVHFLSWFSEFVSFLDVQRPSERTQYKNKAVHKQKKSLCVVFHRSHKTGIFQLLAQRRSTDLTHFSPLLAASSWNCWVLASRLKLVLGLDLPHLWKRDQIQGDLSGRNKDLAEGVIERALSDITKAQAYIVPAEQAKQSHGGTLLTHILCKNIATCEVNI